MLSGCSSVSQQEYNSVTSTNNELIQKCQELENNYNELNEKYKNVNSDYAKLRTEYNDLVCDTAGWATYDEAVKQSKLKEANADKMNAEAEENEAEARLKASKEELSQAEAEEQRKLTEGTTVYEDTNVKINYLKTSVNPNYSWYECVVFLIENKTNGVITFQADTISLDGMDIGHISMSDPVSPQSKGYIYADVSDVSLNRSPKTISGQLVVIDFDNTAFSTSWKDESYKASFVNVMI